MVLSTADIHQGLYHQRVKSFFPNIALLDGSAIIKSVINFSVPDFIRTGQVPPSRPSFFTTPDLQNEANNFLAAYFSQYDSNRDALVDCYASTSSFSLSLIPNQVPAIESDLDRNLLALHASDPQRVGHLQSSKISTILLLNKLPKTKHNVSDLALLGI